MLMLLLGKQNWLPNISCAYVQSATDVLVCHVVKMLESSHLNSIIKTVCRAA